MILISSLLLLCSHLLYPCKPVLFSPAISRLFVSCRLTCRIVRLNSVSRLAKVTSSFWSCTGETSWTLGLVQLQPNTVPLLTNKHVKIKAKSKLCNNWKSQILRIEKELGLQL